MSVQKRHQSVLRMVQIALLTAIVLVLQMVGIVIKIPVLGTSVSLVLIPITLGAILLGPAAGAWLGFVFGLVVYIMGGVMGGDAFTSFLFQSYPVMTAAICLVKSTVAGLLSGLVYKSMARKHELAAVFVASAVTPLVNTGVFILGCFGIFDIIQKYAESVGYGNSAVHFLFIGCAGINFLLELVVNLVFSPTIQRLTHILGKKIHQD